MTWGTRLESFFAASSSNVSVPKTAHARASGFDMYIGVSGNCGPADFPPALVRGRVYLGVGLSKADGLRA